MNKEKQNTAIANLRAKVSPYIVGVDMINVKVAQARHIIDAIDAKDAENERLRKVLIEAENSLCDVYVAIARGNVEAGKSFASNDKTIIAIRAALQPKKDVK